MPRTGRPTELTPETTDEIIRLLKAGNYICAAADMVGVDRTTIARWRRRGRAEAKRLAEHPGTGVEPTEEPYLEFFNTIKKRSSPPKSLT